MIRRRHVAGASALILDGGGDLMRPSLAAPAPIRRGRQLRAARDILDAACAAADNIVGGARDDLTAAERALWQYGRQILDGIASYIEAAALDGDERRRRGEAAIGRIAGAITHMRGIDPAFKGTWGAYDIECARETALAALRRRFGDLQQ